MTNQCPLSNNTKIYLDHFRRILEEMTEKMSSAVPEESISGSFITQMIPHHRAAIEMSENLLQYTTNIPLQNIALNIITSQRQSIENMVAAYPTCKALQNTLQEQAAYRAQNNKILDAMFAEMGAARSGNSIDANFMREMIQHHRGAVLMSENALRYPLCMELVPLLNAIILSQKRGIEEMRQLLSRMGC